MRQPFTHLRLARESLSATYTFTHTLYTPFFSSFSWEEKKRGGRRAPSAAQDVRFIHISIRSMSSAREKP